LSSLRLESGYGADMESRLPSCREQPRFASGAGV